MFYVMFSLSVHLFLSFVLLFKMVNYCVYVGLNKAFPPFPHKKRVSTAHKPGISCVKRRDFGCHKFRGIMTFPVHCEGS